MENEEIDQMANAFANDPAHPLWEEIGLSHAAVAQRVRARFAENLTLPARFSEALAENLQLLTRAQHAEKAHRDTEEILSLQIGARMDADRRNAELFAEVKGERQLRRAAQHERDIHSRRADRLAAQLSEQGGWRGAFLTLAIALLAIVAKRGV